MTTHRRPRRRGRAIRTDDVVAPGLRRRRAAGLVAAGIALLVAGMLSSLLIVQGNAEDARRSAGTAQQAAGLSQDEVTQLRAYLTDRRQQREAEADEVQAQLDDQREALCAALGEVAKDSGASGFRALQRAAKELGCDPLPTPTRSRDASTSTSRSSPSTDRDDTSTGSTSTTDPRPAPAKPTGSQTRPSANPRPAAPSPTPTPVPAAPPAEDQRGPITGTVCNLLGICL